MRGSAREDSFWCTKPTPAVAGAAFLAGNSCLTGDRWLLVPLPGHGWGLLHAGCLRAVPSSMAVVAMVGNSKGRH